MSYEDDDDGGGDRGKLIAIASYYAVHDAELAKAHLTSEGIPAYVWDAQTVGIDPLAVIAYRGVRLAVPERDAPRARAILGPMADANEAETRPVFRVRGTRAGIGFLFGLGLGGALGFALVQAFESSIWFIVAIVGAMLGHAWGSQTRADSCSACMHALPSADVAACPSCRRDIRGTIDDRNERLAAEEALEGPPKDDPETE